MLKINLKGDYIDESVKGIFLKLAKSIIGKLQGVKFELYDDRNTKISINEENIYQFLISKDFYKYNYKIYGNYDGITNEIIKDWLALPCGYAISSLYKPQVTTKVPYRDFYEKHNSCSKEFFDNLKVFQQKNNKINTKNKPIFLEINYPSYKSIVDAFSYNKLNGENRDILLSKMNVNVCPYCNMNYTLNYNKNSKIKASADLDHFYVKSYYPLYALCLYNFIPSCPICNSRLKLDNVMTIESHIYPHHNSFTDRGTFVISNLIKYMLDDCDRMEIELTNLVKDDRINNSNALFQIEQRYQFFESFARELLDKAIIYNDLYQTELRSLLGDLPSLDIRTLIFGKKLTEEEIINESLGKFRMDLLEDLGVF